MNHTLRAAIALACLAPVSVLAEVSWYGRANVTVQQDDVGDLSTQSLNSNASRIGIKGSEKLWNVGLEAIYGAEYEAAFDDGRAGSANDETFKQRNIFVGVKGDFGSLIGGHFDTPLKKSQNKVDLFNDLRGDIATQLTLDDVRAKNSVMYTTPAFAGFTGYVDVMTTSEESTLAINGVPAKGTTPAKDPVPAKDRDNAASVALAYENKTFYAALAYDSQVLQQDVNAMRAVVQYTVAGFQLGLLADKNTNTTTNKDTTGVMGSLQYTYDKWAFKGEYGQSDIKVEDVTVFTLGADYSLSKTTKVFGFYTTEQADTVIVAAKVTQAEIDNSFLGLGMEMNF